ncbi:MAG TPA: ATPase domain-containing protein [Chloroflexia bacterium]|nr:ATPase domain-containing protein [Chloroflexia bacterium]
MPTKKMRILPSGIPNLDMILGGGIPAGSLIMLVGAPGTGKTMLIQQLCFGWANSQREAAQLKSSQEAQQEPVTTGQKKNSRKGSDSGILNNTINKAIYFSTLSEPHDKLLEHISQCDYFNEELFVDYIRFLSLTSVMDEGLEKVADLIVDTVRRENAGLICIDGFRALEAIADNSDAIRRFLYRLSAQLNLLGATTVISLERSLQGSASEGDLTIADGILGMYSRMVGARELNRVEVRKLRGMNRLKGLHTYTITNAGITIYPRLEATVPAELNYRNPETDNRAQFGIPELDELIRGGLPRNSSTLLAGAPGMGKTLLSLHFLADGIQKDEKVMYLGFYSSYQQILAKARTFGIDLDTPYQNGQLQMLNFTPVELETDIVVQYIKREIEQRGIDRLVLDNVSELERASKLENRSHDFLAALNTYLKENNITTLSTYVISKLVGLNFDLEGNSLSLLAENLLLLHQEERRGEFHRYVTILHMRDSNHERKTREFVINQGVGFTLLDNQEASSSSVGTDLALS